MKRATRDWLIDVKVAVANLDIEPALEVRAGPSLIVDGCRQAPEIRQGNQIAGFALLTLGKNHVHKPAPPVSAE
jgi:hypothetical protein